MIRGAQAMSASLFKDFAETKRARDLAYMNGYEVAKEEYRELLHKAEDDLAAARADAERYRWIRDNHEVRGRAMEIVYGMNGSDWDAAIDAAQAQDAE